METLRNALRRDRYRRVDGSETLLDPPSEKTGSTEKSTRLPYLRSLTLLNLAIFIVNVLLLWYNVGSQDHRRNHRLRDCSFFSPIFDRVDIPSAPTQINGTLADEQASIWRQPPSPAVDAAWDTITQVGYHTITGDDIRRLGKDPMTTVRAPPDWDLGNDTHLVQLDLAHQLHCLNVLRKAMYPDYYSAGRALLRGVHAAHCVDVLLQNLLCDASVDVYTHNWVETQKHPFPDTSLNRQCRDFEAVLAWHHKTLIPWDSEIPRPADAVVLPMPPKLREHWSKFQTDEMHS